MSAVTTDNARVQAQNFLQVFSLLFPLLRDSRTPLPLLVAATTALGSCCDAENTAKRKLVGDGMLEVLVDLVEQRDDDLREAVCMTCFYLF